MLRQAEAAGVAATPDGGARAIECAVLRVAVLVSSDRFEDTCAQGLRLSEEIHDQPFLAGVLANFIGIASYGSSAIRQAQRAASRAHRFLTLAKCPYGVVYAGCIASLCEIAMGDLSAARRSIIAAQAVAVSSCGAQSFCAALAACLLGVVCYEESDFDRARVLLAENLPLIRDCVNLEIQRVATVALVRLLSIEGEVDAAHRTLDYLEQTPHSDCENRTRLVVAHERLRLLVGEGQLNRAAHVWYSATDLTPGSAENPDRWDRLHGELGLIRARWLIANDQCTDAEHCLMNLARSARHDEHRPERRAIAVLRAAAFLKSGNPGLARSILAAEFRGDSGATTPVRITEEGSGLVELWEAAAGGAEARRRQPRGPANDTRVEVPHETDRSDFSARELDVLRLVAIGSKNSRIAAELSISENTVKWHVRNILEKFGVPNRISAVAAARQSGLIN